MTSAESVVKVAILDDYQNVALQMADWSPVAKDVEIEVFHRPLGDEAGVIRALRKFSIVCAMRERTLFSKAVFEGLPDLRLLVTTGMRKSESKPRIWLPADPP